MPALAVLLPRIPLGPLASVSRLLLGGLVFGIFMIGVRAGSSWA